jgi:DNA-binding MarR family transcriptional regulator
MVCSAVTRSLNRLDEFDIVHRERDSHDRRSVLVMRTEAGAEMLLRLKVAMSTVAKAT